MSHNSPSVSIIIPAYNTESFIEKTINSVFKQQIDNIELIVIDDGSTDTTPEKINLLFNCPPAGIRTILIKQENMGVSAARNRGIGAASGEYIFFLDSDDYIHPDCLRELYENARNENADLVYCGFDTVDSIGRTIRHFSSRYKYFEGNGIFVLEKYLVGATHICGGSGLFKRELLEKFMLKYTEGCTQGEDVEFLTKALFFASKVCCVQQSLAFYVQRSGSAAAIKNLSRFAYVDAMFRVRDFLSSIDAPQQIIALMEREKIPQTYINTIAVLSTDKLMWKDLKEILMDITVRKYLKRVYIKSGFKLYIASKILLMYPRFLFVRYLSYFLFGYFLRKARNG